MADLHVANVLEESVYGGPHKRVVLAASQLRDHGIQTTIVGPDDADRFKEEALAADVPFSGVGLTALSRAPRLLARFMTSAPKEIRHLSKELAGTGCDIVHVSGGAWSFKTVLATRMAGLPFVWHMNDAYQPAPILKLFSLLVRAVPPAGVLYSGIRAREYYEHYFPSSLPAGISRPPVSEHLAGLQREDVERPAEFGDAEYVAVLVGNVNTTKATLDAVRAVRNVIESGLDVQLLLAGAAKESQHNYLNECAEAAGDLWGDRIVHTGQVADVAPFLLHADLALCTSISESGPMAVWEAAALGCPLVSSDVGDVRAVLAPLGISLIYEPSDLDGLQRSIRASLLDETSRTKAMAARQAVVDELSAKVAAQATADVYRRSAGKSPTLGDGASTLETNRN